MDINQLEKRRKKEHLLSKKYKYKDTEKRWENKKLQTLEMGVCVLRHM